MNCFHNESKSKKKKNFWRGRGGGVGRVRRVEGGVDGWTDEQAKNQFAPSTSSKLGA